MPNTLRVGLIADEPIGLHHLQNALASAGYNITKSLQVAHVKATELGDESIDVWIAELADDDDDACIELLYESALVPIVMGDGIPLVTDLKAFDKWQKRLRLKIRELITGGELRLVSLPDPLPADTKDVAPVTKSEKPLAENVWVLGASMGGPDALKEFLDALPYDIPVAFIIAQHNRDEQDRHLAQVLERHNDFIFRFSDESTPLRHGEVYIMPTESQARCLPQGRMVSINEPWTKPFAPNISEVIADAAQCYKQHSGCIIFSGMSDDGASGLVSMQQNHAPIWCQSPDCCMSASMPSAALATGLVAFSGPPAELANKLIDYYSKEYIINGC